MKASERAAIDMAKELTSGEIKKITFGSAREGMSGSGQAQLAACELLHELGRCKREEYGQWLIFSDFWLGDGPRPDPEKWLATVATFSAGCNAGTVSGHEHCCIQQAGAVASALLTVKRTVFSAPTFAEIAAMRWQVLMKRLDELAMTLPLLKVLQ